MRPCRRLVVQDLNDDNVVGWLAYWRERESLEALLASGTFRAMKGAAQILGELEVAERFEPHSLVPSDDPME